MTPTSSTGPDVDEIRFLGHLHPQWASWFDGPTPAPHSTPERGTQP